MILPENAPDPAKKGGGGRCGAEAQSGVVCAAACFQAAPCGEALDAGNRLWAADFFGFYPMERRAGIGTVNIRACAGLLSGSTVRGGAWAPGTA